MRANFPIWTAADGLLSGADLEQCISVVRQGGVVVVPTETVYGLAADARQDAVLEDLRRIKGRASEKVFPVQVSDLEQLQHLFVRLPDTALRLFQRFSPGPLTVVVPGGVELAVGTMGADGTIGVRIPAHPTMLQMLQRWDGPLAVTSANRSGDPPATTLSEALDAVGEGIAGAVDAGPCHLKTPSTVVDVSGESVRILRQGAIPADVVLAVAAGRTPG